MRAWQVHDKGEPIDVLEQSDIPIPAPGPGQLQVRVSVAGIGLPDVLMARGTYPLTPPLPFTPGQELAGVVTAVGDGVDTPIGTRVMSTSGFIEGKGSFAEYTVVAAEQAFPVPSALDDSAAAGFWIPHMTGWAALVDRGRIAAGDWLAVLGAAGGSGIAAVQLGNALAARVIAVVGDERKADFCRGLGAEAVVVHRGGDLAADLRAATGGRGVDLVYDPVGGAPAEEAHGALASGGRLLAVGFASGRWPDIDTQLLVMTNTSMVGVFAGSYSRTELDAVHAQLSELVTAGRLRCAVTENVAFDELPQALQRLANREVIGKLVLDAPTEGS
ncbi:NADPH:quinone oxidoreductase family protein [Mycobacterium sp. 2YAF39]|uniref:NADPH:quinone oxidoreductase family protein n=1 Tax=Mycobacterium sp. 2YAF39 TaxID=3233033 RepID=UPI003F9479AC